MSAPLNPNYYGGAPKLAEILFKIIPDENTSLVALRSGDIDEAGSTFRGDSGSAARFFYATKATKAERIGSKHPTVKPLSIIEYLCRLVAPKGTTIIDPFAGTGTTAAGALAQSLNAVLIEREPQYQADIRRRLISVS